ncbi:MAG: diaminopimelate decarboxylase [Phycisphaerae bacterium]|nr:diaminopimelate decarboxylase [Phycisphaerae bacterium]
MDHFAYSTVGGNAVLSCERLPAEEVARLVGTPCYVYSKATLTEHFTKLAEAFKALDPLICFSIKSCGNLSICRLLGELGAGMDVVSGGELYRAMAAGVPASRCVYAGVGKTDEEIAQALDAGLYLFNVESEEEFENIARIAKAKNVVCKTALRVNPDVDPRTHRYTSTGKKETKFGVDIERAKEFFRRYGRDSHCKLVGIHLHIGSPIYTTDPYVESVRKATTLMDELAAEGFTVSTLDLGGGFGADYETDQTPTLSTYADAIVPLLAARVKAGLRIILEPGRTLVANAGVLLTRVLYMKRSGDKTFAICDAGMNDLLRPSHYHAFHFIWPAETPLAFRPDRRAKEMQVPGLISVDVVGPICESGDFLALDRPLPPVKRGDLLAIFTAGAYGMAMASRYNAQPLPAEALVDGSKLTVIRARERYEDLVAHERSPIALATG